MEVKPILAKQVDISVVVDPPSGEDSCHDARAEEKESRSAPESQEKRGADDAEQAEQLGERIVEGAEEPADESPDQAEHRGTEHALRSRFSFRFVCSPFGLHFAGASFRCATR